MKCAFYTEAIGKALQTNTHLTSLTIANVGINDTNVVHIAHALHVNNTLTYLDLSSNKFGTEGLIALSDALKDNRGLIELNVIGQSKDFGENALSHVSDMLEHNITLKKIGWRLHSRQSFRINNQITRNNEIERRLLSGMSVDDILPESRRGEPLPMPSGHQEQHHETTTTTTRNQQPQQLPQQPKNNNQPKTDGVRYDEGRLTWWVENLNEVQGLEVHITEPRQKVYICNVNTTVVIVKGKCTKITLERAKGSAVIFDDVISTVEVVNSEKVQLQAEGVVPAIQMDKTYGATIFIQTLNGLETQIVTSQCNGLNINSPNPTDLEDVQETAVPDQFVSRYNENTKKWETNPTDHTGV